MSVNVVIALPNDVNVSNVASVMGVFAGLPKKMISLYNTSDNRDSLYLDVPGAITEPSNVVSCARIVLKGNLRGYPSAYNAEVLYHYEGENPNYRVMIPGSTPFWIAIGIRLVKFFGGKLKYKDCSSNYDIGLKSPRKDNSPSDGKPWSSFQREMYAQKPITFIELADAEKHAAYPD